ncbi:MAG TPA: mechanosensitive ion channel domain-containing protein [Candidatus Limnocylindrales bacterium]|nr:mechanosensitive ion channel domain-containing protein [Candidatus Limnocylindrales bacterium]
MTLFGIHLLGFDLRTGEKIVLTAGLLVFFALLRRLVAYATRARVSAAKDTAAEAAAARTVFWTRQVISLVLFAALVLGLVSVWFDNAASFATVGALFTAGIAVALQRVITAFAAYIIILRGSTFSIGDRIVMGAVRGDVIALDPFQTTIMEMGETIAEQPDAPAVWVHGRQFTGRIVTVNNGVIFDQPVYNYTRDFPYVWDEIMLPIPYDGDDARAERIMLDAVARHAVRADEFRADDRVRLHERYGLDVDDLVPRAFYQLTDNWVAISVRFLVRDHGARTAKDAIFRDILTAFRAEKISVASGTYAIVQVPPIKVEHGPLKAGAAATDATRPHHG